MARKYRSYIYKMKHADKYIGNNIGKDGTVKLKSSWELDFLRTADMLPSVLKIGYEAIEIPYHHPFKKCTSVYYPDFIVEIEDSKTGQRRFLLVEIKPLKETTLNEAGRNITNRVAATVNKAKWNAAASWATRRGIEFVVMTEKDLYGMGKAVKFKPVQNMTSKSRMKPPKPATSVKKIRKPKSA